MNIFLNKKDYYQQFIKLFTKYTEVNTTSDPTSSAHPSTVNQIVLRDMVLDDLSQMGCTVKQYDYGIGCATLPANFATEKVVNLYAHLDTSNAYIQDTKLQVNSWDSDFIQLGQTDKRLYPKKKYQSDCILTTDGTSLLGADDKAAIVEFILAIQHFIAMPEIPHPTLHLWLLPDEEIGLRGAKNYVDNILPTLPTAEQYGICLDCCEIGEYVLENFNAHAMTITFSGSDAHPMNSYKRLDNALLKMNRFLNLLPDQTPANTLEKQGFVHVVRVEGGVGEASIKLMVRHFDEQEHQNVIDNIIHTAQFLDKSVQIQLEHQYSNPKDSIKEIVKNIPHLMQQLDITPKPLIMRGGYDGSYISAVIPTINLFTGAHNFHSIEEYLPLNSAYMATQLVCKVISNLNLD